MSFSTVTVMLMAAEDTRSSATLKPRVRQTKRPTASPWPTVGRLESWARPLGSVLRLERSVVPGLQPVTARLRAEAPDYFALRRRRNASAERRHPPVPDAKPPLQREAGEAGGEDEWPVG